MSPAAPPVAVMPAPPAAVMPSGGELGPEVQRALLAGAEAWAREVAGDRVALAGDAEPVAEVVERMSLAHGYPLLVVWAKVPRLGPDVARAALGDLEAGCDLVLGPTTDGGVYLLGLGRALPPALELVDRSADDVDAVGRAARLAQEEEIDIGLLRGERPLRSTADARAALVDPCTPEAIRQLLRDASQQPAVGSV